MAGETGARRMIGHRLLDRDGAAVGRIGQVYFDDQTDAPTWATVRTGLFTGTENFVPLRGARVVAEGVRVPFGQAVIKSAPRFDTDRHISVEQEDRIYTHYGLASSPEVPGPRASEGRQPGRHRREEPAEQHPAGRPADPIR